MFNKKDLDTLLGIGRVRAPLAKSESIVTRDSAKTVAEVQPIDGVQSIDEKLEASHSIEESLLSEEKTDDSHEKSPEGHERLYAAYENQIAFLQQQLAMKDAQLSSKDDIIKNFQVLMKLEQDTVLKLTYQIEEQKKDKSWRRWFKNRNQQSETAD